MDKLVFINDKLLSAYPEESLEEVVTLCESLLVDHSQRVGDKCGGLYHALIVALTRPSYSLRSRTAAAVKKMISPVQFIDRALALIAEFTSFLETVQITSRSKGV